MTTQQSTDPIQQALGYMRHQGSKGLSDLTAIIERTSADWSRCLEGMSEQQATFAPDGEWSAKQVIGHVLTTNRGINQQIIEMSEIEPPLPEHKKVTAMGEQSEEEEQLPVDQLCSKISDVFADTTKLASALDASSKLDRVFPHPLFGPLNLKEWIAFHRIHAMDHIQQIDKIKADAGYPAA